MSVNFRETLGEYGQEGKKSLFLRRYKDIDGCFSFSKAHPDDTT